jgi:hypothetical protein
MTPLPDGDRVSPAWADGMPLDELNAALAANTSATPAGTTSNTSQRFWATPARSASSPTKDVLEISFANDRLINHITFDAATFPQTISLEYYDPQVRAWVPMIRSGSTSEPVTETVLESSPATLPATGNISGHLHPQHSYSGHWTSFDLTMRPAMARRLRLVLSRTESGSPPVNNFGQPVDYSLAIRDLDLGYLVNSKDAIPSKFPNLGSYTEKAPFAASVDVLGNPVNFTLRTNYARNVLNNKSGQTGTRTIWKSEPQPFPWAVVNFYVDARNSDGTAQTLDRFYVEPVTDGPNLNLYYSNDEPTTTFESADDPIRPNVAAVSGKPGSSALHHDNVSDVSFVDVDNEAVDFNPGKTWWMGFDLNFNYTYTSSTSNQSLIDCEAFNLAMTPSGLRFTTDGGHTAAIDVEQFMPLSTCRFVVYYDGMIAHLFARVDNRYYRDDVLLTVPIPDAQVQTLRFGGFLGGSDPGVSAFNLNSFCLKLNDLMTTEKLADYFDNAEDYARRADIAGDDTHKTVNAILRYHPDYVTTDFPSGFVGGPPDYYADMEWSPIARDFKLARGFLYFPPTKAKYWKMEFCNLVPQPYDVYVPIKRHVVTYSQQMWTACTVTVTKAWRATLNLFPGLPLSIQIAAGVSTTYTDGRRGSGSVRTSAGVSIGIGVGGIGFGVSVSSSVEVDRKPTSTTVRVVNDVSMGIQLGSVAWAWSFVSIHGTSCCPRFVTTCKHEYDVYQIEQKTKIAYFVGLQVVEAYRVNYLAADDTAQYVDEFNDAANIAADTNWVINESGQLVSGASSFAQATSKVFPSNKTVRAVQFATSQSAPRQILPDPDFDDYDHAAWEAYGDGTLATHSGITDVVGNTLRVDRASTALVWDYLDELSELETVFPSWDSIRGQGLTFYDIEHYGNPRQAVGGVQSGPREIPPGGRVHVAARVVAPHALDEPLWCQIVDVETDRVLAESQASVSANQVVEWYASYTIGEGGQVLAHRWSDFTTDPAYASFLDTFVRANASVLTAMDTNQDWRSDTDPVTNAPLALALSGNEAAQTNASGLGRSWVDVKSPWGALEVTLGAMGTGQTSTTWLAELAPYTIRDDGSLWVSNRTYAPTSGFGRTLVAGDKIRIETYPTRYLPVNRYPAGFDPTDWVSAPYAMVLYLNGSWVRTLTSRYGVRTNRALRGRTGQHFRGFSWTPAGYGPLPGPVLPLLPFTTANGTWAADQLSFDARTGDVWTVTSESAPVDPTVPTSAVAGGAWAATADGATVYAYDSASVGVSDTGYWYGALSVCLTNVAKSYTGAVIGNIACLDYDNRVYLSAAGDIVRDGISYGTMNSAGFKAGDIVSIQFADTKQVPTSVRGTIDPVAFPRMIVVRTNAVVTGVLASVFSQAWTGTKRGIAGTMYYPGTDDNGNIVGMPSSAPETLHTAFNHFHWAPNASAVSYSPNTPTFDDVTGKGTTTYLAAQSYLELNKGRIRARVVQKGQSNEVWNMDNLSVYVDPIVWYFSNDGGANFFPAYDIKNDPHGVMSFPEQNFSQSYDQNFGQALVWRVISYAPDSMVTSLVIRPWYAGLLSGITHRLGAFSGDPNVMPYDHYPDIQSDSRFQVWHNPIPEDWWYHYRLINRSKDANLAAPQVLLLPENVVSDLGGN